MRHPDVVSLENQSVISGGKVYTPGMIELVDGQTGRQLRRRLVVHPSDQSKSSNISLIIFMTIFMN